MDRRNFFAAATAGGVLAACSRGNSKFKTYNGPPITGIVVNKGKREMFMVSDGRAVKKYEGDGKTPEGTYFIDRRNPNSRFHLSLGISYPNAQDIATARALGQSPGGDIFIHGQQNPFKRGRGDDDWTWGCVSVTNREMEDIYAMVRNGTPITINP